MQWWCSAQGVAWEWTWRPYVGVWLFVLLLALGYGLHLRALGGQGSGPLGAHGRHVTRFGGGLVVLWLALDWPLGPLGASYLASVHMVQFLLVSLVAPPLLLLGLPSATFQRLAESPRVVSWLRDITHPLTAFFIFNVVMTATHWPAVVDASMATQLGSFALDLSWLVSGLVFWWPVVSPVPERSRFGPLLKGAYLALNAIIIRPPFAFLLFSKFPVYATYELAPPIPGTSVMDDQQLAGGIMKVGMAWILMVAIGVLVRQWYHAHHRPVDA